MSSRHFPCWTAKSCPRCGRVNLSEILWSTAKKIQRGGKKCKLEANLLDGQNFHVASRSKLTTTCIAKFQMEMWSHQARWMNQKLRLEKCALGGRSAIFLRTYHVVLGHHLAVHYAAEVPLAANVNYFKKLQPMMMFNLFMLILFCADQQKAPPLSSINRKVCWQFWRECEVWHLRSEAKDEKRIGATLSAVGGTHKQWV